MGRGYGQSERQREKGKGQTESNGGGPAQELRVGRMEWNEEQARRGPKRKGRARQEGQRTVGVWKVAPDGRDRKTKEKEKGSRIEGGGRGGQTEDRQMEETRRDRWEGGEADGERSHGGRKGRAGGSREKEVAEKWERGVETPGTGKGRGEGQSGGQADGRDPSRGGQATKGKATRRKEKWGNEEGREQRGARWPCRVWDQEARKGGRQGEQGTGKQAVRQSCPRGGEGGGGVESRPSRERDREKES